MCLWRQVHRTNDSTLTPNARITPDLLTPKSLMRIGHNVLASCARKADRIRPRPTFVLLTWLESDETTCMLWPQWVDARSAIMSGVKPRLPWRRKIDAKS